MKARLNEDKKVFTKLTQRKKKAKIGHQRADVCNYEVKAQSVSKVKAR